jgi:hypothetical protein
VNEFRYILNHVFVKLKPSSIQGIGLYAIRDIPENVELFTPWNGPTGRYTIPESKLATLPKELYTHIKDIFLYAPDFPNDTNTYITLTNGCHWIYTTPYYFVNSDLKNYNIDKDSLRSTRRIRAGEEILSNYGRYERLPKSELI